MNIGVFSDWVAEGAAFGIKAFFAIAVFVAFCAAVLGVITMISNALGGGGDNGREEPKRRPY